MVCVMCENIIIHQDENKTTAQGHVNSQVFPIYLQLREIPPTNNLRLSFFVGETLLRFSWFLFACSAERDVKSVATVVVATAKSFSLVIFFTNRNTLLFMS